MKVIGIDIAGRDVRIIALEKSSGTIINYTRKYKPIRLEDDEIAKNVILFKNTLFATIDSFSPDVIVINYRDLVNDRKKANVSFNEEYWLDTNEVYEWNGNYYAYNQILSEQITPKLFQ